VSGRTPKPTKTPPSFFIVVNRRHFASFRRPAPARYAVAFSGGGQAVDSPPPIAARAGENRKETVCGCKHL